MNTLRHILLRRLIAPRHLAILQALEAPDRWQPEPPITPLEAEAWGAALQTDVGRKVDVAMINMAQQQAQIAIHTTTGDLVRQAGYAAGFRAAWAMAKSISTIGAKSADPEATPNTGGGTLDHLNP